MRFIRFLKNNTVTLMYCFALLLLAKAGYADELDDAVVNPIKKMALTVAKDLGVLSLVALLFYVAISLKLRKFEWLWTILFAAGAGILLGGSKIIDWITSNGLAQ